MGDFISIDGAINPWINLALLCFVGWLICSVFVFKYPKTIYLLFAISIFGLVIFQIGYVVRLHLLLEVMLLPESYLRHDSDWLAHMRMAYFSISGVAIFLFGLTVILAFWSRRKRMV